MYRTPRLWRSHPLTGTSAGVEGWGSLRCGAGGLRHPQSHLQDPRQELPDPQESEEGDALAPQQLKCWFLKGRSPANTVGQKSRQRELYLWCDSEHKDTSSTACVDNYIEQIVTEQWFFRASLRRIFIGSPLPHCFFQGAVTQPMKLFVFKGLIPAVCLCAVNHTVTS